MDTLKYDFELESGLSFTPMRGGSDGEIIIFIVHKEDIDRANEWLKRNHEAAEKILDAFGPAEQLIICHQWPPLGVPN